MDPKIISAIKAALYPGKTSEEVRVIIADSGTDPSMLMELIKMLLGEANRATMAESKLAGGEMPKPPEAEAEAEGAGAEEGADMEEAPEVGAFADAVRAADAAGVTIVPTWKLVDLQRAILVKRGVKSADSMTGDALTAVVSVLSGVPLADAYDALGTRGRKTETNVVNQDTF